ncbi:uncharacterized protein LOC124682215 [Lolium rigidum]|uniref:uncharacterized protein LOC124682215 n=1 Tax=Lolium rigidum TaxID=89674 RepID=UPI001F5CCA37|nr:uncharacterized protein LOC124682215 [Lolium rigidum]
MCVQDLKYCLVDISIVVKAPTRASPPTPATSTIRPTTMSSSPFKPWRKLRSGRPASCRSSTAGTQSYLRTMQLLSLSDYIEVEELGRLYDVFNNLSAYDVIGAQNYRRPFIRLNRIMPEVHKQFDILIVSQLFPEGRRGLARENDAFPANIDSMACNMSGYQ